MEREIKMKHVKQSLYVYHKLMQGRINNSALYKLLMEIVNYNHEIIFHRAHCILDSNFGQDTKTTLHLCLPK